jgi:hypothetical protein
MSWVSRILAFLLGEMGRSWSARRFFGVLVEVRSGRRSWVDGRVVFGPVANSDRGLEGVR